jgi:hypothetical protein
LVVGLINAVVKALSISLGTINISLRAAKLVANEVSSTLERTTDI